MIPVNRPALDGNEKKYLDECIDTGWISSEGSFVKRLEEGVSRLLNCTYGIAVANGSVAIDLALAALSIGEGDEVIIPAFTIISCAAAVVRSGARPVVVDCDPHTWNMRVDLIEENITKRTKAIMAVHIYGLPVDMDPLCEIARKHDLFIIEDAAEQIGQTYKSRAVGSLGTISTVSFYPNKHITTGEGGMVLTSDEALANRCRSLRNLCFDDSRRYIHQELGWNFRLSNIQAALGVAQIERIEKTIARKREIGSLYHKLLSGNPAIELPIPSTQYAQNIYWVFGLVLNEGVPFDAVEAINRMRSLGVDCRHFFWPMHKQPALLNRKLFDGVSCPNSEKLAARGFYIPSGAGITDEEIQISASAISEILQ